jgi:hypothetical protein
MKRKHLGSIKLESGQVRICDPLKDQAKDIVFGEPTENSYYNIYQYYEDDGTIVRIEVIFNNSKEEDNEL